MPAEGRRCQKVLCERTRRIAQAVTPIFDVGWFKLRIAGEYQQRTPTTQTIEPGMPGQKKDAVAKRVQKGVGASFQFMIDPVIEFGANADGASIPPRRAALHQSGAWRRARGYSSQRSGGG